MFLPTQIHLGNFFFFDNVITNLIKWLIVAELVARLAARLAVEVAAGPVAASKLFCFSAF